MIIKASSKADLTTIASKIIEFAEAETIWLLLGEMGAGKTTLTKVICQELGVLDNVHSPTFSIVNEYLTSSDETVYHFDFYRMEEPEEALGIGLEEYLDSGNICILEWPQIVERYLPENFIKIQIEDLGGEERTYKLTKHG